MDTKQAISVSIQHKVNLGNYESADAFIALSGLTAETTEEEMNALLDQGKIAFRLMANRIKEQLSIIKEQHKNGGSQ